MDRISKDEVITLEDNIEYYVIDTVLEEDTNYLYLAQVNDPKQIMIAKEVVEGEDLIVEELEDGEKKKEIILIILKRLDLV